MFSFSHAFLSRTRGFITGVPSLQFDLGTFMCRRFKLPLERFGLSCKSTVFVSCGRLFSLVIAEYEREPHFAAYPN